MLDENVGSVGVVAGHGTPTALEDRVERARRLMQQRKVKGAIGNNLQLLSNEIKDFTEGS